MSNNVFKLLPLLKNCRLHSDESSFHCTLNASVSVFSSFFTFLQIIVRFQIIPELFFIELGVPRALRAFT